MGILIMLIIAAGLGIIPATIAERKGHSFWLWWFYGWMLFIVAIIHVQFIEDLTEEESLLEEDWTEAPSSGQMNAEEIRKELSQYKAMVDEGLITQEDFDRKKVQLLEMGR